ncbi:hypothetical protein Sste5344_001519 [Sporothrix stenoceras]
MPTLSQRPRRRPAYEEEEEEERPRHRRRQQQVEEEEEEEEEDGEGDDDEIMVEEGEEGEEEEEEDDDEEEEEEEDEHARQREQRQREKQRRRREAERRQQQQRATQQTQNGDDHGDDDDDDEEDEEEVANGAAAQQMDRQRLHYELLAKKLTRYALASEPRRLPIRRQAVKEQVLLNEGKHFRKVFPIAQDQLRGVFGMNMVDWPAREKTTMTMRERRKALKSQSNVKSGKSTRADAAGNSTKEAAVDRYLLVSTLPSEYQECVFTPIVSDPDAAEGLGLESAIPPAPDAAYMGFVTLVVAFITLSGGEMANEDLEKLLSIVHNGRSAPARADEDFLQPVAAAMGDHIDDEDGRGAGAGGGGGPSDDGTPTAGGTLQHMVRQGYLVRVVEVTTTGEGRGNVGGRGVPAGAKVTWHVGPRGQVEIGPAQVADIVYHIYGDDANADLERRLRSSLRMAGGAEAGARQGTPARQRTEEA